MEQQNDDFDQVIEGEFEGRIALVGELDACRIDLSYQLTKIANQLEDDPVGSGTLDVDVSTHRQIFKNLARHILDDEEDGPDNVSCLIELFTIECRARSKMMGDLLDTDIFHSLEPTEIAKLISRFSDESEDHETFLERIADMFEVDLNQDINAFIHIACNKYGKDPHEHEDQEGDERVIEIKKDLKEHAADVAKIIVGVTAALALDRFLRRKQ